jgi:hypothetical protein
MNIEILRDPVAEGENTHEDSELDYEIQKKLIELKELIESPETRTNVREILSEAEVVAVICGIKPASHLQKESAEALLSNEQNILSDQDFIQLEEYLNRMGLQLSRDTQEVYYHELFHIYSKKNAIQAMIDSDLFTEEELDLAKEDIGKFLGSYLVIENVGKERAYRVGVLLGYPLPDVKDFIKLKILSKKYSNIDLRTIFKKIQSGDTQNNYDIDENDWEYLLRKIPTTQPINITGINGSINWKTFNINDPVVIKIKNKYKHLFDIQKNIMGK